MTRDTNSAHHDPKRPPMGDIGPATETLAQVLAQLREITREAPEPQPEEYYRPLQPRSAKQIRKQIRKPVRLQAPATRRRWPVAVGSCALLLAGALALPAIGPIPATDMEFLRGKLQVWLGHETITEPAKVGGNQEQPVTPATRAVAAALAEPVTPAPSAPVATTPNEPAAPSLPPALRREVAAIQPEPAVPEQSAPLSTASIRPKAIRVDEVILPVVDVPEVTLTANDLGPVAPQSGPAKTGTPAEPLHAAGAAPPPPAQVGATTTGLRVASLGEVTIRPAPLAMSAPVVAAAPAPAALAPVLVAPQRPVVATALLTRAQELIRNRDISSARLVLEKALSEGSAEAAFQLAETYDPQVLSGWQVRGIIGDPVRARQLYTKASESGVKMAEERLKGMN